MECYPNCSVDRCKQVVHTPTTSQAIAQGEVLLIGAAILAFALEVSKGATLRASETDPSPALSAMVFECEDVTVEKNTSLAVTKGDKLYWDVTDNEVNKTASGNYLIGCALEDAIAAATTVRASFYGGCVTVGA